MVMVLHPLKVSEGTGGTADGVVDTLVETDDTSGADGLTLGTEAVFSFPSYFSLFGSLSISPSFFFPLST